MKPATRRALVSLAGLLVLALLSFMQTRGGQQEGGSAARDDGTRASPTAPAGTSLQLVVKGQVIASRGRTVFRGDVDLAPTVERILEGRSFPHRNDGGLFQNREGRLPARPRGHYREYVHPTPGLSGPGPQRLVVGADGEWFYTPDHYRSFLRLSPEGR